MALAYLTLFTGLTISVVAIYYSVAGLAAIFAAAAIPIIIMGTVLEVSKLVAAWWLKWNWNRAPALLKYYLLTAVILLMIITSMGIFGFLSKAHIEQTASASQGLAYIERIESEIRRNQQLIDRAETRLQQLETQGSSVDLNIQQQIDQEQSRIEAVLTRVQPAIDEQQRIIDNQITVYQNRIDRIDAQIDQLERAISQNNIARAQSIVGANPDGRWGPQTALAVREWQASRDQERADLIENFEQAVSDHPTVKAAQLEIQRIRQTAEQQIADSNQLISRLRAQLGQTSHNNLETQIATERQRITDALAEIETLSIEKFSLETTYRKLEAEVGPIKYIAKFVYGNDADADMLSRAVTWMIILIIIVFDPLAVLLLIASQVSFRWNIEDQQATKPDISSEPDRPSITEPVVTNEITQPIEPEPEHDQEDFQDDDEDQLPPHIKAAKTAWKIDNPGASLKHQRKLLEAGLIDKLPWLLPPYFIDHDTPKESK